MGIIGDLKELASLGVLGVLDSQGYMLEFRVGFKPKLEYRSDISRLYRFTPGHLDRLPRPATTVGLSCLGGQPDLGGAPVSFNYP